MPFIFQDFMPGGPAQPITAGQLNQNFSFLAGCITAPGLVSVDTVAALRALTGGVADVVRRAGFTAAGDGGAANYYWSASATCTDNGGDCVAPNAGFGRWLADFSGTLPTPMIWGCKGDGVTNDANCFQAAVTAIGNHKLYAGPFLYRLNTAITASATGFEFVCENKFTPGTGGTISGVRAGAANLNLLTMTGPNQAIRDCYIDMSNNGAITNASGTALTITGENHLVSEVNIYGQFIGIDEAGNVGVIEKSRVTFANGAAGATGIRMGHSTTNGTSVDLRINTTVVECPTCATPADNGILMEDCGGCTIGPGIDLLQNKHNFHIAPTANQFVIFLNAATAYLSDTGTSDGVWIDCNAASAQVYSLDFVDTWSSSSSGGDGVLISNTGGCMGGAGAAFGPKGVHFVRHRSLVNGHHGFHFIAGNEISIDDSSICANSFATQNTYNGITLESGVHNVQIRNTRDSSNCDNLNSQQFSGIFMLGANANIMIVGNDLSGNQTAPISTSGLMPTGNSLVKNNIGLDDNPPNVTAATTLVPGLAPYQIIRGTTSPVTAITPSYNGQQITFVTFDGTINFNTGGTPGTGPLCNALSAVPFVPFVATYVPGFACWTVK